MRNRNDIADRLSLLPSIQALKGEMAKREYLEFYKLMWQSSHPLQIGWHTKLICDTINWAIERYRKKISTTVVINIPPRHGKSDLCNRFLPPYFLGHFPEDEVIVISHNLELTQEFSRFSRNLIADEMYQDVFPAIEPDRANWNVRAWSIKKDRKEVRGKTKYFGIQSGISGAGASLLIIDDYHATRQEAENELIRNKIWDEYNNGALTRLAPVYIQLILCTRWHIDDLVGRMLENPDAYPIDRLIKLPSNNPEYKTGVLFPERYDKDYLELRRQQLGEYAYSALYLQEPVQKGGNVFKVDQIKIVEQPPTRLKRLVRCWDLASSSDTGDYTVGVKGGMVSINDLFYVYIDDVVRFRKTAPHRNKIIKGLALSEGIPVVVEGFGAYKDAYENLFDEVGKKCNLDRLNPPGSKEIKAQPLEPIMEFGRFYIRKAPWNEEFIEEFRSFPNGKNDDIVDATSLIYWFLKTTPVRGIQANF